MNRRQFLLGAAAVPIAAVGQQERFLVKTLGVPKSVEAAESAVPFPAWATKHDAMMSSIFDQQQIMLMLAGYALAAPR